MAEINIRQDEITDRDRWPDACMRCGKSPVTFTPIPKKYTKVLTTE